MEWTPHLRLIVAWCAFSAASAAAGQDIPASSAKPAPAGRARSETIPRVSRAPKIVDFLENRPREAELAVTDFRQNQPGDGTPATESTAAYLSYDSRNLYVVFVCRELFAEMRAHLSKRDDTDQDDAIAIFLDTFRDAHRAYYFSSNPLGIQADAIYTEPEGYDFSFDTLWYTETRLTDFGYIVSFAIPFKSLRFSHAPDQTWTIGLCRNVLHTNEVDCWPYVTQRVKGLIQQFAPVSGLREISPGRNIQLIPYGLLAGNHFLDQTDPINPAYHNVFEHRPGLDAKFVLHDALTFDATVNPDFSQVETDDPQVTVNQRFAVYFPEKRPFFIENAAFFETPINLFFSRQVADPQFGTRMTGKIGRWLLGALVIDDRQPGLGQPPGSQYDKQRAGDAVVRVAREFGNQSQIGAFFSSHDFVDTNNRVASLDTRLKLSPNWLLEAQAAHSWTRQSAAQVIPDDPASVVSIAGLPCLSTSQHFEGNAYWLNLVYSGRHAAFSTDYDDKGAGFCTDLGFVNRVDVRKHYTFGGYFWKPKRSSVIAFGPSAFESVLWDHSGQLQEWQASASFEVDFTRQTTLVVSRGEAFERFLGIAFRKHSTAIQAQSAPYKWLAFNARFTAGTGVNYYPAPDLPGPFLGNTQGASGGFTLRPNARLRFDQTYIFSRLGVRGASAPPGSAPGQAVYNNHLLRSKFNYQFTRELSLRLILDYNSLLANPDLLDLQTSLGGLDGGPLFPTKNLTPSVLFTYLLHPGTALYVGYTDGYSNLQLTGLPSPPLAFRSTPTTPTARIFFVKASYLLRF
jgi:hypothetical protein